MRQIELEGRVQNLEVSMQAVLRRLRSLELNEPIVAEPTLAEPIAPPQVTPPPVVPPPVRPATFEPPKPMVVPSHVRPEPEPASEPLRYDPRSPYSPAKDADDLEYKVGINGLLRGGAVVIVCAVLFLVAIGLHRGWITPTMQFIGELLLCFGFVGIGIWKHDEREDFGKLMVGVGSCGIYASLAGAHLFKHIISSETLVAALMAHSLAVLGYAHWRASKSFFGIGMIGGIATAILPISKQNYSVDLILHFLVMAPTLAILARRKWADMTILTWVVSTVALLPLLLSDFRYEYRVGAIYLNSILILLVNGYVYKESEFDPWASLQTVILLVGGALAVGIESGKHGSVHELILAASGAAVAGALWKNERVRNSTLYGSLVIATILAPIGCRQNVALTIYAIDALLLAAWAWKSRWTSIAVTSVVTLLISFCAYLWSPTFNYSNWPFISQGAEAALLVSYASTIGILISFALRVKNKDIGDLAITFGGVFLVSIFLRGCNLAFGYNRTPLTTGDLSLLGLGIASIAATLIAKQFGRIGTMSIAIVLVAASIAASLLRNPIDGPLWLSPLLLTMAGFNLTLGVRAVRNNEPSSSMAVNLLYSILISGLFLRGFEVAGQFHWFGIDSSSIYLVGFLVLGLFWSYVAVAKRSPEYVALGWMAFSGSALTTLHIVYDGHPLVWLSPASLLASILTLVTVYSVTPRNQDTDALVDTVLALAGWALVSSLLKQELIRPWIGMKEVAASTVGWVVVAISLISAGFATDRRYLRYWSLAIFMVTVGKVFLIDLANTDSFIRVLMLMVLGLGMVACGYWYIVWKRRNSSSTN